MNAVDLFAGAGGASRGLIDAQVHAICRTPHIAQRIAQLLDRHGLADIPDTPADLVPE